MKEINSNFQSGLSLIEIIISILLLGVVASFIALAIPTSASLSTRTDKMETTTVLAQKYIEEVKATYANDSSLYESLEDGENPPIDVTNEHTEGGTYNLSTYLTIQSTDDDGVPSLVDLEVTVAPVVGESTLTESDQAVTITAMLRRDR